MQFLFCSRSSGKSTRNMDLIELDGTFKTTNAGFTCVVSMYVSLRLEGAVIANVSPSNGEE